MQTRRINFKHSTQELRQRISEGDAPAQARLQQMYRAWRGHNENKIAKMNRAQMGANLYGALFDARNRTWAPRIVELARSPSRTLICAGVGHLVGPNSVRELLARDFGLTTKRVQP